MLALLPLMAMASAPRVEAPPAAPAPVLAAPVIAGGYAPISPRARELAGPVKAALAAITPARTGAARTHARVLSAQRQVVAGTNYRLVLQLRDGSRWQAVVWHRLDGSLEVTEATRLD